MIPRFLVADKLHRVLFFMPLPGMMFLRRMHAQKRGKYKLIPRDFLKKILFFLFISFFALGSALFAYLLRTLPDPVKISQRRVVESTKIFDRSGSVLLYEIHGEEKRTVIPFEEIPQAVRRATVAIEDANFYQHSGIDFRGILRAFIVDFISSSLSQGGSTITQQLIKNSFLGGERTVIRKIKEAVLAVRLESEYSKDQILNLYLNEIPYGSNAYGIEAAAETFFGKPANTLTLREVSILASLPKAPSYYSPYGSHKNELVARADLVLERMQKLGLISEQEYDDAKKESVSFIQPAQNMSAPHFVVLVRDYLTQKYGEDAIENGGFKIITTLDWRLQQEAEKALQEGVENNTKTIHATNGALVATNPKTGDVLALVGSKDYFDTKHEGNFNVATATRQPGSAFKPFVYATALTKGFTPETVLFDVPTEFNPTCPPDAAATTGKDGNPCYHPKDYDGKFRGPITLRQSLAQSINVTSVKLLYLAGIDDSIKTAQSLGISTLNDRSRLGLSLVLGGAEVKLLDMVSAYGVFANDGVLNPKTIVLEVEKNNVILEKKEDKPIQALDSQIARTINDMLSDNEARQPVFHPRSSLYFPGRPVAAKTGTTQDYRDAWTIGYTPSLAAGVWVGNNDNSPIQQSSGVLAAAPIWHKFLAAALATSTPEEFPKPEKTTGVKPVLRGVWQGSDTIKIDSVSKKRATSATPPEFIKEIPIGTPHSILYFLDKKNILGPAPQNPENDSQYRNWEYSVQQWLRASNFNETPSRDIPSDYDDIHVKERLPVVALLSQETSGEEKTIITKTKFSFPKKEVSIFVNNALLQTSSDPGDIDRFILKISDIDGGVVTIRAYDAVGNVGELIIQ